MPKAVTAEYYTEYIYLQVPQLSIALPQSLQQSSMKVLMCDQPLTELP